MSPQSRLKSPFYSAVEVYLCNELRPTVLLVHGSAASLSQYLPLATALNETLGSMVAKIPNIFQRLSTEQSLH